jgi:hypothetical protein
MSLIIAGMYKRLAAVVGRRGATFDISPAFQRQIARTARDKSAETTEIYSH